MPSSDNLEPLWCQFPTIPWGSAGWRMGHGDVYWHKWHSWWIALTAEGKLMYQSRWPEMQGWEGFYAWANNAETPHWMEDERQKTGAAALPPRPDENTITERYRVKWLATKYFCKPKVLVRDPYEKEFCQILADPEGWLWKLHLPKSTEAEFKAPYFTRQVTEVIGNDNLPVNQPVA